MSKQQYSTADLIDHLADAVDAAREAAGDNARWQRAIDAAWDHLLTSDVIEFDAEAHELTYHSESGATYVANGSCQCPAHKAGQPCKHRAAARIVRRALERRAALEVTSLAAELVADAHEAGCGWYGAAEGIVGARMRMDELDEVARVWDEAAAMARAALGARIGAAQSAAMSRALAA